MRETTKKDHGRYNETKLNILKVAASFQKAISCQDIANISGQTTDTKHISVGKVRVAMCHYSKFRHRYFDREPDKATREYRYKLTNYGKEILQKLEKKVKEGKPLKL